jgi:hypothetical protein
LLPRIPAQAGIQLIYATGSTARWFPACAETSGDR